LQGGISIQQEELIPGDRAVGAVEKKRHEQGDWKVYWRNAGVPRLEGVVVGQLAMIDGEKEGFDSTILGTEAPEEKSGSKSQPAEVDSKKKWKIHRLVGARSCRTV